MKAEHEKEKEMVKHDEERRSKAAEENEKREADGMRLSVERRESKRRWSREKEAEWIEIC